MKKSTLIVAALLAIGFTSCKKDYTCECKDSAGAVISSSTINNTKALAKTACEATNAGSNVTGFNCALK